MMAPRRLTEAALRPRGRCDMLPAVSRTSRARVAAAIGGLALFTSACATNGPQDPNRAAGPIARQLNDLFNPVFYVAAFVFFLIHGLVIYAAIRYRRRSDDDAPKQIHGHTALELTWTAIPALILAIVAVFTVSTVIQTNKIDNAKSTLQVTVTGHQWWWEYAYPGLGVVTANELHIPTGRKVQIKLESVDVIHSFWPPRLAGKVDVIPGVENHMQIQADAPGEFEGQCAEFCGIAHSRMRLRVIAQSPADFDKWVSDQKVVPGATAGGEAAEGAQLFQSRGCPGCHTIQGVSEGKIGPNLTHLFSRETFAGSLLPLDDEHLRRWLRNPQAEKPGNNMKLPVPLKEEEITKLIAYLRTLK